MAKDSHRILMESQLKAEFELAHAPDADRLYISRRSLYALLNSLAGIASNATACGACAMGASIAHEALDRFEHQTGISREASYQGMKALNGG